MFVNVQVQLGNDEIASASAADLAQRIMEVFEGDPTKDTVTVQINDSGMVGAMTIPTPPITPPIMTVVNSTFATNNSPPPADKQTRTNTTLPADITAVYVDDESTEGNDISAALLSLIMGDRVEIHSVADPTRYVIVSLAAPPIDQDTFVELPVTVVEAGNNFTGGACTISFIQRP